MRFVIATGPDLSADDVRSSTTSIPYAIGGEATAENISLRCAAHNAYEAELIFGTGRGRPAARSRRAD
jgi:hypothetical protein